MNYFFGRHERLAPYNLENTPVALNLFNIWKLSKNDNIFITKAWCPLIEFICKFKNRPSIIQFADGLITERNCKKQKNSFPHILFSEIYADILYVRQPLDSLPNFIDQNIVRSIVSHSRKSEELLFDSIVLVFGNDPLFDFSIDDLKKALKNFASQIDNSIPLFFSSKSKKINHIIFEIFSEAIEIGRFSNNINKFKNSLMIMTPSTVGYDFSLRGSSALCLSGFECSTIEKLFPSSDAVKMSKTKGKVKARVFKYHSIEYFRVDLSLKKRNVMRPSNISLITFKRWLRDIGTLVENSF